MPYPVIPEYITVHLGAPDAPAENVTVPFPRYIKGVAASEIYPTWEENALRANVLAQISVALNRVYTEYYRSRGYDFDITNNTQFDQAFSPDQETFDNINAIVDDSFNNYIVRRGNIEPLYAQFCDGVRTRCRGLSQWGSQELAAKGKTFWEILQHYYGQDIELVYNAPVGDSTPSYPGRPLTVGSAGEDVRTLQRELNRIHKNYPAIPAIAHTDGVFGADTAAAVKEFQRVFELTQDGVVGKATWYRIKSVYNGVKSLSEVTSEGLTISEAQREFPKVLRRGDVGIGVQTVRFYLAFLGFFLPELPRIRISDVFDDELRDAVLTFQSLYGLTVDGTVGRGTWNTLQNVYEQTLQQLPAAYQSFAREVYPGQWLLCQLNREFPTWLTIWSRGTLDKLSGGKTIKTGSEAFDKRFLLTGGDEAAVLRILTPNRLERLLALSNASFGKFAVNLNPDGRLYLAVHSGRGFFDIGKGYENPEQLRQRFARELNWFTDLIEIFRS